MRRSPVRAGWAAVLATAALVLTGCGAASPEEGRAGGASSPGQPISVVTSTNVYGSIAEEVGGDTVRVSAIISDPGQDPHSYEANTRVALQLSEADLVIENGGGYDDFVDTMLRAGKGSPVVLNAVQISGFRAPAGGELNEHVWYSLPTMDKLADQIAVQLGKVDPQRADTFRRNAARFHRQLDPLVATERRLEGRYAGAGVGITEPVPLYLLDAIGLVDKTPPEFSDAVEEGAGVSAAVLEQTLNLYADRQVEALVYNAQTSGPVIEEVTAAAARAGVPTVAVTETLPAGQTYVGWMADNLARIGTALEHR